MQSARWFPSAIIFGQVSEQNLEKWQKNQTVL